jgi:hypothetical protein
MPNLFFTEHDFMYANPWFTLSLDSKLDNHLRSHSFKYAVDERVKKLFPDLLKQNSINNEHINFLKQKLTEHTDSVIQKNINEFSQKK